MVGWGVVGVGGGIMGWGVVRVRVVGLGVVRVWGGGLWAGG